MQLQNVMPLQTKQELHPLTLGNMPLEISGLVNQVKAYELLTAEAGITGDYETALMALSTNPLIPSVNIAKKNTR